MRQNKETETIIAWLTTDVSELVRKFMDSYSAKSPFRDFVRYLFEYEMALGIEVSGVSLLSTKLSYRDLNRVMFDFNHYEEYQCIS